MEELEQLDISHSLLDSALLQISENVKLVTDVNNYYNKVRYNRENGVAKLQTDINVSVAESDKSLQILRDCRVVSEDMAESIDEGYNHCIKSVSGIDNFEVMKQLFVVKNNIDSTLGFMNFFSRVEMDVRAVAPNGRYKADFQIMERYCKLKALTDLRLDMLQATEDRYSQEYKMVNSFFGKLIENADEFNAYLNKKILNLYSTFEDEETDVFVKNLFAIIENEENVDYAHTLFKVVNPPTGAERTGKTLRPFDGMFHLLGQLIENRMEAAFAQKQQLEQATDVLGTCLDDVQLFKKNVIDQISDPQKLPKIVIKPSVNISSLKMTPTSKTRTSTSTSSSSSSSSTSSSSSLSLSSSSAKDDTPSLGKVTLKIKSGKVYHSHDKIGKDDPYVIVSIGGVEKRTKTIDDSQEPVWNEVLVFDGVKREDAENVKLTLYDEDTVGSDDIIGTAQVSVVTYPPGRSTPVKITVSDKGQEEGTLALDITVTGLEKKNLPPPPSPSSSASSASTRVEERRRRTFRDTDRQNKNNLWYNFVYTFNGVLLGTFTTKKEQVLANAQVKRSQSDSILKLLSFPDMYKRKMTEFGVPADWQWARSFSSVVSDLTASYIHNVASGAEESLDKIMRDSIQHDDDEVPVSDAGPTLQIWLANKLNEAVSFGGIVLAERMLPIQLRTIRSYHDRLRRRFDMLQNGQPDRDLLDRLDVELKGGERIDHTCNVFIGLIVTINSIFDFAKSLHDSTADYFSLAQREENEEAQQRNQSYLRSATGENAFAAAAASSSSIPSAFAMSSSSSSSSVSSSSAGSAYSPSSSSSSLSSYSSSSLSSSLSVLPSSSPSGSSSSDMEAPEIGSGKVLLYFKNGRIYHSHDALGKDDPYVVVSIGGVDKRTKTINDNMNPVWNESIEFDDVNGADAENVKLSVYDEDTVGTNDLIGTAKLDLIGYQSGRTVPLTIAVFDKGKEEALLEMDVTVTGFERKETTLTIKRRDSLENLTPEERKQRAEEEAERAAALAILTHAENVKRACAAMRNHIHDIEKLEQNFIKLGEELCKSLSSFIARFSERRLNLTDEEDPLKETWRFHLIDSKLGDIHRVLMECSHYLAEEHFFVVLNETCRIIIVEFIRTLFFGSFAVEEKDLTLISETLGHIHTRLLKGKPSSDANVSLVEQFGSFITAIATEPPKIAIIAGRFSYLRKQFPEWNLKRAEGLLGRMKFLKGDSKRDIAKQFGECEASLLEQNPQLAQKEEKEKKKSGIGRVASFFGVGGDNDDNSGGGSSSSSSSSSSSGSSSSSSSSGGSGGGGGGGGGKGSGSSSNNAVSGFSPTSLSQWL